METGIAICYPKEEVVGKALLSELPLGVVIVEGKQYSLITARLAMNSGVKFSAVPGNVTSFVPNQLRKRGAKRVTSAEEVIEGLPTSVRAALVQAEAVGSAQRNLLAEDSLTDLQKRIYGLLSVDEPRSIDSVVETSELNSSEVLATLFDLEMVRQLPGSSLARCCCKRRS